MPTGLAIIVKNPTQRAELEADGKALAEYLRQEKILFGGSALELLIDYQRNCLLLIFPNIHCFTTEVQDILFKQVNKLLTKSDLKEKYYPSNIITRGNGKIEAKEIQATIDKAAFSQNHSDFANSLITSFLPKKWQESGKYNKLWEVHCNTARKEPDFIQTNKAFKTKENAEQFKTKLEKNDLFGEGRLRLFDHGRKLRMQWESVNQLADAKATAEQENANPRAPHASASS